MSSSPGRLTLGRWTADRARAGPDRVAIVAGDRRVTYAELDSEVAARTAALAALGLGRGDRVATPSFNRPGQVAALFACARAGLVLAPLNWRLSPAELAWQIDHCRPGLLLVDPELADLARSALGAAQAPPPSLCLAEVPRGDRQAFQGEDVGDDDPLFLLYTSGTTGRPKGAVLTHANCFWTNLSLDRTGELRASDVVLSVLPQCHAGGWNVQPLLAWWKGAVVVLPPRFDPAGALALVAEEGVTAMMGVPATYLLMAEQPGFATTDLSSLRLAMVGGAPMPEALLRTWQARGVDIVQGYGLTEASPNVCCLDPADARRRLGWAGKPYPHVDVDLVDPLTGARVAGPGRGELVVRGPNVFAGYWEDPGATAAVVRDGWLHTGDMAERDGEGCYRICDRLKDVYISGGENVYPAEVEGVIHDLPAVAEAAVVGIPDQRWGEVGLAVVVARAGSSLTAEEVVAHCRARLAGFKVPRRVEMATGLPRNNVGKVQKGALRQLAQGPRP
ncbi:MAG: acyl-CoA synthetase [Acidimicrobiales bacterium]